jgi:glutamyl-tRNA reductase
MIINIRIDHKMADIETMETVSKDLKELFLNLKKAFDIKEYVEINTCNRYEYFINADIETYDNPLLDHKNKNIQIQYDDDAIINLFRMTSGIESMIIGEDQILGQVKDAKLKSEKEEHLGAILNTLFTKAIHVGQVVRNKTKINQGSISIGSAAVDLAEEYFGTLHDKCVLVLGAGKMGTLVAKALAEKNLKAIFVANRTYYKASRLAKELGGEAILIDDIKDKLIHADLLISATGAPHPIFTKEKMEDIFNGGPSKDLVIIDIANPRDITEDVEELGIKLCNIDDLRTIADKNKKLREKEVKEAEIIIEEEFFLLKESFNLIEINEILGSLRKSMEEIRVREYHKAISKLDDVDKKTKKTINGMTKSIVNKIFYDISENVRNASIENEDDILEFCEAVLKRE